MPIAQWIWKQHASYKAYNQTVLFRKEFHLASQPAHARLCITADSWYRLFVNDEWVNDGPCRSWPDHYQYDEIDLAPYLREGQNELRVIAKYWGTGTFHTLPQQAGFWAQIELIQADGGTQVIGTDGTWQETDLAAWRTNTPKVSIQMEPQEFYDARLEAEPFYEPAAVLFEGQTAPWQDLHPRDVPLLTRVPVPLGSPMSIQQVRKPQGWHFCLPAGWLVYPEVIEANRNALLVGGLASLLKLSQGAEVHFQEAGVTVYIDGKHADNCIYPLEAGEHWVLVFITQPLGHNKDKDFHIYLPSGQELRLENPVDPAHPNPWCWLDFSEFACAMDDLHWPEQAVPGVLAEKQALYLSLVESLGSGVASRGAFQAELSSRVRQLPKDELFSLDTHWRTINRQVVGGAADLVQSQPEGWIIQPGMETDIELIFDLGEQNIGYYQFELEAEAGVELDLYGVEFITKEGVIQHTAGNRNGLTYITRQGINRFTSTKRRSGRYLFLTLHNQKSPVILRSLQLIESTYPVQPVGSFHCSDERLNRIWDISARTLKLCMEDTFTDCPLYEQTLWVGDARNESHLCVSSFRRSRYREKMHHPGGAVAGTLPDHRMPGALRLGYPAARLELFVGHLGLGLLLLYQG